MYTQHTRTTKSITFIGTFDFVLNWSRPVLRDRSQKQRQHEPSICTFTARIETTPQFIRSLDSRPPRTPFPTTFCFQFDQPQQLQQTLWNNRLESKISQWITKTSTHLELQVLRNAHAIPCSFLTRLQVENGVHQITWEIRGHLFAVQPPLHSIFHPTLKRTRHRCSAVLLLPKPRPSLHVRKEIYLHCGIAETIHA
jgi:hypothetical protein